MKESLASFFINRLRRLRGQSGFSLVEMLVTTLIMVMVTAMVAAGIPVAMETYAKTVNAANAQAVLSTTLAAMREELGMATDARLKDEIIYYKTREGAWASFSNAEKMGESVRKQYWRTSEDFNMSNEVKDLVPDKTDADKNPVLYPLIPDASITEELQVDYEHPDVKDGVVTLGTVRVTDAVGRELASVVDYKIKTHSA